VVGALSRAGVPLGAAHSVGIGGEQCVDHGLPAARASDPATRQIGLGQAGLQGRQYGVRSSR
jgi:hypothetical protein